MFSEKLIIKNFGPFAEQVEFEFNRVSIIIGPQASGKSIVAKLITILRNIEFLTNFHESLKNFNILIFANEQTEIHYFSTVYDAIYLKSKLEVIENYEIKKVYEYDSVNQFDFLIKSVNEKTEQIKQTTKKLEELIAEIQTTSDEIKKKLFTDADKLVNQSKRYKEESDRIFEILKDKEKINGQLMSPIHYFKYTYYLPSERLFYSMFKDSIASIIQADVPLPKILIEFGAMVENFRNNSLSKTLEFQDIKFEHGGEDVMVSKGSNKIPVSYASSGIQSLYPILLMCESIKDKQINVKGSAEYLSITIEEPELNLYPQAQNEIIKRIITATNSNDKVRLTITTHSPYILTTINNLLFKSKVEKLMHSQEAVSEVASKIDFNDRINFEDISAYYIENGKADNLIDQQTQLINAKKLDSISYTINSEFSELMTTYRKLNG